jgi:subtilisin family serine protease
MGAKISSNSWGGGGESAALKEAIQRAHAAGSLFIAAAGNNSSNNDTTPNFPSNYPVPNVLAVAAIDNQGKLASFSNYGKKMVHIAAPGVNVYSSVLGGSYGMKSGTSMATPHVSGIAALIASNEPNLTNVEIKERIIQTARPLASVKDKVSSRGMASAYAALTKTIAPPDANDPENWQSVASSVSSSHPYGKKANEVFDVKVDGANEISLYFEKFESEKVYDKLSIYDAAGNLVDEISGLNTGSYSTIIKGNSAKLIFTSDESVEKYGFDISKIAYR